jgi:hypothetical protein
MTRDWAKWCVMGVLASGGVVAFACGGASTDVAHGGNVAEPSASHVEALVTTSAAASSAPPPMAAPLVVVPMTIDLSPAPSIIVEADGSVVISGHKMFTFIGPELRDAHHDIVASVEPSDDVTFATTKKTSRFNAKDELEVAGGEKIVITDDGTINVFDARGKPDSDNGSLKIKGFKPVARRAALVLVEWMQLEADRDIKTMPKLIASVNRVVQALGSASASSSAGTKSTKP